LAESLRRRPPLIYVVRRPQRSTEAVRESVGRWGTIIPVPRPKASRKLLSRAGCVNLQQVGRWHRDLWLSRDGRDCLFVAARFTADGVRVRLLAWRVQHPQAIMGSR
jgi:hypothetical protein